MDDNPNPAPSSNRISDRAAVAEAPANIAAQDIALTFVCAELKSASGKACMRLNSSAFDRLAVLDSAMIKLHSDISADYCTHDCGILFDGVHKTKLI
jgi:phosphoribosylformylglycinamidine (FGAM) synthase-like enzyme